MISQGRLEGAHLVDLHLAGLGRSLPLAPGGQTPGHLGCQSLEDLVKGRVAKSKMVAKSPLWTVQAQTGLAEMHWKWPEVGENGVKTFCRTV